MPVKAERPVSLSDLEALVTQRPELSSCVGTLIVCEVLETKDVLLVTLGQTLMR